MCQDDRKSTDHRKLQSQPRLMRSQAAAMDREVVGETQLTAFAD
jgi:hypothetical protein